MKAIICLGDSITFGRGGTANKGWVFRLDEYFSSKDYYNVVYNLGIPGDGVEGLLKRVNVELTARVNLIRPDDKFVILIGIGLNDSRLIGKEEQISIEDYMEKMTELVKIAKGYTSHVVLLGLTNADEKRTTPYEDTYFYNERIGKFNSVIEKVAEDNDLKYLKFDNLAADMLGDGIHPNDKGYEKMYLVVKKFLLDEGLIE